MMIEIQRGDVYASQLSIQYKDLKKLMYCRANKRKINELFTTLPYRLNRTEMERC
jgi:hypothetical protein